MTKLRKDMNYITFVAKRALNIMPLTVLYIYV